MKYELLNSTVLNGAHNEEEMKALTSAVFDIASLAHGHLSEAKKLFAIIPRESRSVFFPSVRCTMFLDALQQANFNPYHESLLENRSNLWYQLRLLSYFYFNRF